MSEENETAAVGVIHGRFQMLHNDHLKYLLAGKSRCDHLVIGITNAEPNMIRAEAADGYAPGTLRGWRIGPLDEASHVSQRVHEEGEEGTEEEERRDPLVHRAATESLGDAIRPPHDDRDDRQRRAEQVQTFPAITESDVSQARRDGPADRSPRLRHVSSPRTKPWDPPTHT